MWTRPAPMQPGHEGGAFQRVLDHAPRSKLGARSWLPPLGWEGASFTPEDPLAAQIRHVCAVIRGEEAPFVSGREGLMTLKVIEAVKSAAVTKSFVAVR